MILESPSFSCGEYVKGNVPVFEIGQTAINDAENPTTTNKKPRKKKIRPEECCSGDFPDEDPIFITDEAQVTLNVSNEAPTQEATSVNAPNVDENLENSTIAPDTTEQDKMAEMMADFEADMTDNTDNAYKAQETED